MSLNILDWVDVFVTSLWTRLPSTEARLQQQLRVTTRHYVTRESDQYSHESNNESSAGFEDEIQMTPLTTSHNVHLKNTETKSQHKQTADDEAHVTGFHLLFLSGLWCERTAGPDRRAEEHLHRDAVLDGSGGHRL